MPGPYPPCLPTRCIPRHAPGRPAIPPHPPVPSPSGTVRGVRRPSPLLPRCRADLAAVLAPGPGRTLPGPAYTDPDVFAWELAELWATSWVCVGRLDDLLAGVTQRAVRVGDALVVLTTPEPGTLDGVRGFHGICRHRGHELLAEGGADDRRRIVCPYHAWAFALDGSLVQIARADDDDRRHVDPAEWGLLGVGVEVWRGWVFVALGDAGPFTDHVGDLDRVLAPHDPGSLGVAHRIVYDVAANWKVVAANYHECYHCPTVHPELARVADPDADESAPPGRGDWIGGPMPLAHGAETLSESGRALGPRLPGVDDLTARSVWLGQLLPNLFVGAHPDHLVTHRTVPLAPDRTLVECDWLAPVGVDVSDSVTLWDRVNRQDWEIVASVQRGVADPGYRPGPLLAREASVRRYERAVARAHLTGRLRADADDPSPAVGSPVIDRV